MTSSSSTTAAAIPSASPSTLSPHAAPFALPARPVRAPLQDGDVSRSMDGSIVMHGADKISGDTHPASSSVTSCFRMESCDTVLPTSTCGANASQPRSWPEICRDTAYPSSICFTSAVFSHPSVMMASNHKQKNLLYSGMGSSGSRCSTVKIERPPNKISETNKISCSLMSNPSFTQDVSKSNEDTVKIASFPQILEVGTEICSKEASPVSHVRPLHISTAGFNPCGSVADDLKPDPSECSVDSPCWRGASDSHLSSFDVFQTSSPQLITQESKAFGAGQKPSTFQNEVLTASQNVDIIENKQFQSHVELSMSMKSGDIGKKQTEVSHNKELESAEQCAAKCTAEQKYSLELRENSVKRSGLNFAAPDFIPSSVGKSKNIKGSCSMTGRDISGILKAMGNLSEMLRDSCSLDENELDEHEHTLLQSVIENLQTCLDKKRKGLMNDGGYEAGLRAPHSQSAVSKSDAGDYRGSCTTNGGNDSITVNKSVGPSHMLSVFGRNSLTCSQPSFNNIPRIPCEEDHSQILIYKNLWIDAERTNCELKYLLKQNRMKIGQESSMAHIVGPRNPSSQACDFGAGPSNSYGAAISYAPTLCFPKGDPTEETSKARNTDLLYPGDRIRLGDNSVPSCSASTINHPIRPNNFQGDHLTVLEETGLHHHAQPVLQLAPSRAHRELRIRAMDEASGHSCFTGADSILSGNSEYGLSSDWEHVLKEEISWS
uniref:Uncharacterized protein n=1 Tax=Oryza punctata TaxID=4537 RepID=A0A0E0LRG2_ORYPU